MRKVIYSKMSYAEEAVKDKDTGLISSRSVRRMREQGEAMFHEFVSGVDDGGAFVEAIIEFENGRVGTIPIGQIKFISGEIDK